MPKAPPPEETPLPEMRLSVRTVNTLEKLGAFLAKDLLALTGERLSDSQIGRKTVTELTQAVKALGLKPPRSWAKVGVRRRDKKGKSKGKSK